MVALSLTELSVAVIPDQSLASCQQVAAQFDNTCDGVNVDNGATVTCTGSMECPGSSDGIKTYTSSSPCTYTRKLCVQCFEANGVVKIRVTSNGLPNHCMYDKTPNTAVAKEETWMVNWNPNVNNVQNYSASDVDSEAKTTELLCDLQRTSSSNMHSSSEFVMSSSSRML